MTKHEQIISHLPRKFYPPVTLPYFPGNRPNGILSLEYDEQDLVIYAQVWDGSWYRLEETDWNYDLVADAIIKRLHGNNTLQSQHIGNREQASYSESGI